MVIPAFLGVLAFCYFNIPSLGDASLLSSHGSDADLVATPLMLGYAMPSWLLAFLAEPRSLEDVAEHRFVYRKGDAVSFAEPVERRSMRQHIERLSRAGRVREVEPGRFQVDGSGAMR